MGTEEGGKPLLPAPPRQRLNRILSGRKDQLRPVKRLLVVRKRGATSTVPLPLILPVSSLVHPEQRHVERRRGGPRVEAPKGLVRRDGSLVMRE